MRLRIFKRFSKDRRGAAAVEMALVAAPFLAMLIACIQLGIVYLAQSALDLATEKSARLVLTGTIQNQSQSKDQFLQTVCSNLPALLDCSNLMVDAKVYADFASANTSAPTISYNGDGTPKNDMSYNVGGSGDIVVLRVLYLMPVIGGPLNFTLADSGSNHLMIATAVFRNEPYKSGSK